MVGSVPGDAVPAAPADASEVKIAPKRSVYTRLAEAVDDINDEIDSAQAEADVPAENTVLLFKTTVCPNCRAAVAMLDKAGVNYITVNAEEDMGLVNKYGIRQAPTLIVPGTDSFEKYRGVAEIKNWLKDRA